MGDESGGEVMDEVRKVDCRVREAVERDAVGGEFDVATRDGEVDVRMVTGVGCSVITPSELAFREE